jgi:hypothetical protein
MDGLTEGRIVHYVLPEGHRNAGQHRPAMVTRLWEPGGGEMGCAQLNVFEDGSNDNAEGALNVWRTSVLNDEATKAGGTWHWIERA